MDKELKEKWIAALRSGKYKQGGGQLRKGGADPQFCCLGVLCEVAGVERSDSSYQFGYEALMNILPDSHSFGLSRAERLQLMVMNDNEGKTFAEIADYIEEYL